MPHADELAGQVAAILHALQAPVSQTGPSQMPCQVTVCIPVYNAWRDLGWTLHALEMGTQSVPLKIMLAENGSDDGTQCVLRDVMNGGVTLRSWMSKGWRDVRVVEVPYNEEYPFGIARTTFNMRECYRAMLPLVDTPFVLFVDADVEAPRGAVRTMLEVLQRDPDVGVVGIQYDPSVDHVKCGMMMMRTEWATKAVDQIEMKPRAGGYTCPCSQINEAAKAARLKCVNLSPLSARHAKLEV